MRRKRFITLVINGNLLYLFVVIFCLIMGFWILKEPAVWTYLPQSSTTSGKKVVIDAGHGGIDPGAKSQTGLLEKDINLDVAMKLKRYLSQVGVYCIMIRENDRDFFDVPNNSISKKRRDLVHRTQIANESKADLFLSIHADSFPQSIYRGAQTFFNRNDPLSKKLAQIIQFYLVKELGPNNRLAKPGDFRVLNDTKMPGVTIEVGFLSNPEEAKLLSDPKYRDRLARAIFHGVVGYFNNQIP